MQHSGRFLVLSLPARQRPDSCMTRSLFCFFILFLTGTCAEAQTPHISGDVFISLKDGTLRADLEVSGLPTANRYFLRLNTGMAIRFLRDSTNTFNYSLQRACDTGKSAESCEYWLPAPDGKGRYLPGRFRISYVGAFPVHDDPALRSERGDWKGNIAFNGQTIRATEQSVWYPVILDPEEGRAHTDVTYDLTFHTPGAKAHYLNGSAPQYGPEVRFQTTTPYPLMLFAGDFDFKKERNTWLVNTTFTAGQALVVDGWFTKFRKYYEEHLQIPYGTDITLLASTPVSKRNNWMFVTYPTIASVSPDNWLNTLVDEKTMTISDSARLSFLAHELGHYYFGSVFRPNSTLHWAFLEGMTEYMSLLAVRDLVGKSYYDRQISQYVEASRKLTSFVPLGRISNTNEVNHTYRYQYIPLLMTALEQEFGQERIWQWLSGVLHTSGAKTDYVFFRESLLKSGIDPNAFKAFEERFLTSSNSLQDLLALFPAENSR